MDVVCNQRFSHRRPGWYCEFIIFHLNFSLFYLPTFCRSSGAIEREETLIGQHTFRFIEPIFPYNSQPPFNSLWCLHKFIGGVLRYEFGLCIRSGKFVRANGTYVWTTNVVTILRNKLCKLLNSIGTVLTGKRYWGHKAFGLDSVYGYKSYHQRVFVRFETVNGGLI